MKFSYLGPQAISRGDFWSFITAVWLRNLNLCLSPAEAAIYGRNQFNQHIINVLVQSSLVRSTGKPGSQSPVRSGSYTKTGPVWFLISKYFRAQQDRGQDSGHYKTEQGTGRDRTGTGQHRTGDMTGQAKGQDMGQWTGGNHGHLYQTNNSVLSYDITKVQ